MDTVKKNRLYGIIVCALFAALMCIFGPMSLPIGPIPISLTTLVIYLATVILGWKGASIATMIYLLLGAVGLPVFSGYAGGLAKIAGPTGGYILGYILVALIGGFAVTKSKANIWISGAGLILGTAALYLVGTVWFVLQMDCEWGYALSVCVVPFILIDLGKIVVALLLGKAVRAALKKANLFPEQ